MKEEYKMTLENKQEISATARKLIKLLHSCDDKDYVRAVIDCVEDGEIYPCIDPKYM